MKNDALLYQSAWQGIYQRAGKVNGKTSWISSNSIYALWYNAPSADWMIGYQDYLGSHNGAIISMGNQGMSSCPYNVPKGAWKYFENGAWMIADANDVSVECLNSKLLVTWYKFVK